MLPVFMLPAVLILILIWSMEYYSDSSTVPQDAKDAVADGETATEMLISETSEGQLIIAHRDHGMQEGWHMPSFTRQHLC